MQSEEILKIAEYMNHNLKCMGCPIDESICKKNCTEAWELELNKILLEKQEEQKEKPEEAKEINNDECEFFRKFITVSC